MRKIKLLFSCLKPLVSNPSDLAPTLIELTRRLHSGGIIGVKAGLLEIKAGKLLHDRKYYWQKYQQNLEATLKPQVMADIQAMDDKPLISVLMPTYNTPPKLLQKAINSIANQWYPNWELCIADDGSSDAKTLNVLAHAEAGNSRRIKVKRNQANKSISITTNSALSMASGEYVVLMDHDDLLQPQALYRVVQAIQSDQPDFIYSDEAQITKADDDILMFMFRPQFSLENLRSQPYIVHLIAFRTAFIRQLGGLDEKLTISQDYDLILRAAEQANKITHIPEVLYLWRVLKQSAGHQMQHRVMETSSKILQKHLDRCGEPGKIEEAEFFNFFEVRYPLNQGLKVAIIIPTKNCGELVHQCIESIEKTVKEIEYTIVLVDHDSDEPASKEYFDSIRHRHTVIQYSGSFNFSAINNFAVSKLPDQYSHYLFCNNDIEAMEPGWLERMLELGQQEDVAIVGAKLLYPDKTTIQHAGVGVGIFAAAEHYGKFAENYMSDGRSTPGELGSLICNHELSAVTAACMLMKASVFHELGGFDEQLEVGFGDIDLCLRARDSNYRVLFCPHATLLHHESYSRGVNNEHKEDTAFFRGRWQKYMEQGDPYFNPNFREDNYHWIPKDPLPIAAEINTRTWEQKPTSDPA